MIRDSDKRCVTIVRLPLFSSCRNISYLTTFKQSRSETKHLYFDVLDLALEDCIIKEFPCIRTQSSGILKMHIAACETWKNNYYY